MTIGDQPAFPSEKCYNDPVPGMTYRMWLVGIIMAGLAANPNYSPHTAGHAAKDAFEAADAIIARKEMLK